MAGHVYSVIMKDQTIIANSEMVTIRTATAATSRASIIEILRAWCGQGATETSEQLGVQIVVQASAFGTFTSTAPSPHQLGGNASGIAGGTAQAAATSGTDSSANAAGTKTVIVADSFNNLNGWLWVPTPEERLIVPLDTCITLAMVGTATTLTNWTAGVTFQEIN